VILLKTCSKCKQTKSIDQFLKKSRSLTETYKRCKECEKDRGDRFQNIAKISIETALEKNNLKIKVFKNLKVGNFVEIEVKNIDAKGEKPKVKKYSGEIIQKTEKLIFIKVVNYIISFSLLNVMMDSFKIRVRSENVCKV
jgi:hypothetical protein